MVFNIEKKEHRAKPAPINVFGNTNQLHGFEKNDESIFSGLVGNNTEKPQYTGVMDSLTIQNNGNKNQQDSPYAFSSKTNKTDPNAVTQAEIAYYQKAMEGFQSPFEKSIADSIIYDAASTKMPPIKEQDKKVEEQKPESKLLFANVGTI